MSKVSTVFNENTKWKSLFLSILMMAIGYGLHKGIVDNYLAEVVGMKEFDRGATEFFRELPGFLLIFILAIFYKFSAEKMYKMGGAIMIVGMGLLAFLPPYKALVIFSIFLYSAGEHIQLGMKNTLSLEYSKDGLGGQALGYQNAIYQAGNLLGYVVVIMIFALWRKCFRYQSSFCSFRNFMFLPFAGCWKNCR